MVPRTFPSTYQTANGETRMVVFFLSSVSGLRKWVDYIPVKFTMLETQVNNSYNNNGVILVDPLSSTTNRQAWVDYVPVFVDENDTAAWRVDANGFIPVGFSTKPTLNLDFAGTKSLDSRVTFSRGSNATLFDSSGNLVYAKHNLLTYSEQFDNAAWTKTASSVTANSDTAPNGTATAEKLIEDATNAAHVIQQSFTPINGVSYTFSAFVKAAGRNYAFLGFIGGGVPITFVSIDLVAGTVSTATGVPATSGIQSVGNDWYRVSITVASTGTASTIVDIRTSTDGVWANRVYTGDGTSGILIWGAQLNITPMEGGVTSSLSTYYPTVASAYYAPRFDHNPTTLQSLGLLIEEQRTNSLLQSGWAGAVGGSPGTAPTSWAIGFGTGANTTLVNSIYGTAEQAIKFDADATERIMYQQAINVTSGVQYAMSVFIEAVSGSIGDAMAVVSGTASLTQNTFVTSPSTPGRYTILFTANGTGTVTVRCGIGTTTAVGATCSVTMSRPQVEAGAFATSYIPTTVAAATRNADVASMTGTNFSSWYNQSEMTFYVDYLISTSRTTDPTFFRVDDGSDANRIQISTGASFTVFNSFVIVSNVSQGTNTSAVNPLGSHKTSFGVTTNSSTTVSDGTIGATDTSVNMPSSLTRATIGNSNNTGSFINGHIRRIAYYPVRLSNDQLQALTR